MAPVKLYKIIIIIIKERKLKLKCLMDRSKINPVRFID